MASGVRQNPHTALRSTFTGAPQLAQLICWMRARSSRTSSSLERPHEVLRAQELVVGDEAPVPLGAPVVGEPRVALDVVRFGQRARTARALRRGRPPLPRRALVLGHGRDQLQRRAGRHLQELLVVEPQALAVMADVDGQPAAVPPLERRRVHGRSARRTVHAFPPSNPADRQDIIPAGPPARRSFRVSPESRVPNPVSEALPPVERGASAG